MDQEDKAESAAPSTGRPAGGAADTGFRPRYAKGKDVPVRRTTRELDKQASKLGLCLNVETATDARTVRREMGETLQGEWAEAIGRHRAAVTDYLRAASSIEEPVWRLPVGPNKWCPAQITDHVIRTYQIAVGQVRGGPGIRIRYGFLLRQTLRLIFLRRIFRTRRLPGGAKAPREIQPGDSQMPHEVALSRLDELSGEFEREILLRRGDRRLRLTHHIFGEIEPLKGVDFLAIHTEHHGRQLPG